MASYLTVLPGVVLPLVAAPPAVDPFASCPPALLGAVLLRLALLSGADPVAFPLLVVDVRAEVVDVVAVDVAALPVALGAG